MNERPLFDPDQLVEQKCPACPAIRQPGETRAPNCGYELERDGKRWKGCLNAYDPSTAPFPEGF